MYPLVPRVRSLFGPLLIAWLLLKIGAAGEPPNALQLTREGNWLVITGARLPAEGIRINYLEAYCRPGSTDADWVKHTVIPHRSETLSADPRQIVLRDTLEDGVVVDHKITAGADEVTFELTARNPTDKPSEAHWAQPCVRLSAFTGYDEKSAGNATDYLPQCFIFVDGTMTRMPTKPWAEQARYTPGQVWVPARVPRTDVNPRPVSSIVPSNGLIGCYNATGDTLFATAWMPYQELFQGVARCLHSDLRIGGLAPGEEKRIRGKIYVIDAKPDVLLERYQRDFPEAASFERR